MSDLQHFDISACIEGEFDYSSVSHNLPEMIANSNKLIKLRVAKAKPFYAFSEESFLSLIEDILLAEAHKASFFDGMELFESGEKIGLEALDCIEPRAPEYDKRTIKKLFDKHK